MSTFPLLPETTSPNSYSDVINCPACATNDDGSKDLNLSFLKVTVHFTANVASQMPLGSNNHVETEHDSAEKAEKDNRYADPFAQG